MDAETLFTLLLGGGGVAFLTAGVSAVRALMGGVRSREKEAIATLANLGAENAKRADVAEDDRDYWRNYAGMLLFSHRKNGIEPPDPPKRQGQEG